MDNVTLAELAGRAAVQYGRLFYIIRWGLCVNLIHYSGEDSAPSTILRNPQQTA
jgi:hypothetical protein